MKEIIFQSDLEDCAHPDVHKVHTDFDLLNPESSVTTCLTTHLTHHSLGPKH